MDAPVSASRETTFDDYALWKPTNQNIEPCPLRTQIAGVEETCSCRPRTKTSKDLYPNKPKQSIASFSTTAYFST